MYFESAMSITLVFADGGSQAVRIPKEFRLETNRVSVQPMNGGLLLLPAGRKPTIQEFFAHCDEFDANERPVFSSVRRRLRPRKREFFAQ